ncbi:MAG TPA: TIGR01777 family oxidoreductase [Thermoanaerobaculia bacterium]|nr:TIGR01777 family oxidoreductase [Thermoanaerobaculia bacterium]HUM29376.1 TIGR01777 family oxidoreductase [Thermoanaerobaculia bacterium]HXK67622.1 TIGR01777 family oxidoreductase [Thermoanaerobaculia bacterium]
MIPERVVIAGGTGFIGGFFVNYLLSLGSSVTVITRFPKPYSSSQPSLSTVTWNDCLASHLEQCDLVVNLSGEPLLGHRWTSRVKRSLFHSRVDTTLRLAREIRQTSSPPPVFLSCSAIGYYGDAGDTWLDEKARPGKDFLSQLCVSWEEAASSISTDRTRVVTLRFGVVLHPSGGMLAHLIPIFRTGLGGPVGTGKQWLSWVSMKDTMGLMLHAWASPQLSGPLNVVSPSPLRQKEFAKQLGASYRRPSWIPVPALLLKLLFGQASGVLLGSQRVRPARAEMTGYSFHHATLCSEVFKGSQDMCALL